MITGKHQLMGKIAIVTGSSRGIGFAIAQHLIGQGAFVVLTGRNEDALSQAVQKLPSGFAYGIAGKSQDPQHQKSVLDWIATHHQQLDILINNAGINPVYGPLLDLDNAAAQKILDVNVIASLSWVQQACKHPQLNFSKNGTVINLASISGLLPANGIGFYGISKAALIHLTRTLALELAPSVRVNAVVPAVIKTDFARALYEGREQQAAAQYPLKRLGTVEDVATAVVYLASANASWITGQTLVIDGGISISGASL